MVARTRIDRSLIENLRSLTKDRTPGAGGTLSIVNRSRDPIPVSTGTALDITGSTGTGLVGDFVERDVAEREFFATAILTSTDGLFTIELDPVKIIVMEDSEENETVFEYKNPFE